MTNLVATLSRNAIGSQVFDLGEINNVTLTYTTSLTSLPITIYGFLGTFTMDTGGVGLNIKLSYVRSSPNNPNNSSSDSKQWSNAYWKTRWKNELNQWQTMSNGFVLTLTSPDTDLFPNKTYHGFITTMPLSNGSKSQGRMEGTIDFKVGSLDMS